MFKILVDDKRLARAVNNTAKALNTRHAMLNAVARGLRDNVRNRLATQDGGTWDRPSKWVRAKKRTSRALSGQARNVFSQLVGPNRAIVAYSGTSRETGKPISLTEHHFGRTLPASGLLVRIPIRAPGPLGLTRGTTSMWFRWTRDAAVPARRIWPDRPGEANKVAEPIAFRWLKRTTDRTWK